MAVLCTSRARFGGEAAVPATPFFGSLLRRQNFYHTVPPAAQVIFSGYFMFVRNDLIDARVVYSILRALARALIDRRAFKREAFILTIGQKSTKLTCIRRICSFFFFLSQVIFISPLFQLH